MKGYNVCRSNIFKYYALARKTRGETILVRLLRLAAEGDVDCDPLALRVCTLRNSGAAVCSTSFAVLQNYIARLQHRGGKGISFAMGHCVTIGGDVAWNTGLAVIAGGQ